MRRKCGDTTFGEVAGLVDDRPRKASRSRKAQLWKEETTEHSEYTKWELGIGKIAAEGGRWTRLNRAESSDWRDLVFFENRKKSRLKGALGWRGMMRFDEVFAFYERRRRPLAKAKERFKVTRHRVWVEAECGVKRKNGTRAECGEGIPSAVKKRSGNTASGEVPGL